MSLTGTPFLVLAVLLVAAVPAVMLTCWNRIPGPGAVRLAARAGLTLLGQLAAVLAVLVWVNDSFGLYDSWNDLLGGAGQVRMDRPGGGRASDTAAGGTGPNGTAAPAADRLRFSPDGKPGILHATATGPGSHLTADLYVWLPPQYGQARYRTTRFPVVELLPGYPGSPRAWFGTLDAQRTLARLIARGRARPMVLVAATMNVLGRTDPGCADLPHGPRTATWLGADVPRLVEENLRVAADPAHWTVMGYSAGAYCAVNLALHHPGSFGAAVSLSGYNAPIAAPVARDPALARANNPYLLLRDHPARQPRVDLLMAGSLQDGDTVFAARSLLGVQRDRGAGRLLTVSRGGHNTKVWSAMLPDAFGWISARMPR